MYSYLFLDLLALVRDLSHINFVLAFLYIDECFSYDCVSTSLVNDVFMFLLATCFLIPRIFICSRYEISWMRRLQTKYFSLINSQGVVCQWMSRKNRQNPCCQLFFSKYSHRCASFIRINRIFYVINLPNI